MNLQYQTPEDEKRWEEIDASFKKAVKTLKQKVANRQFESHVLNQVLQGVTK